MGAAPMAALVLAPAGCGGDPYESMTPYERHLYLEPVEVATAHRYEAVAMGHDHSCMLTSGSEAWCRGADEHGKLGAATSQTCVGGNVPCSGRALRAAAPRLWAALSPGERHRCGLDGAGQAGCWGDNGRGQVGQANVDR